MVSELGTWSYSFIIILKWRRSRPRFDLPHWMLPLWCRICKDLLVWGNI